MSNDKAKLLALKAREITNDLLARNIGREKIVRASLLALISGRPAFFLGSPGINKTGTVQDLARRIDGAIFYDALMPTVVSVEQLLVESTSIEEVPTDGGGKEIRTKDTLGRAASAHILFADEIWKAEARVLQTLLDLSKGDGVRHDGQMVETPLMAFIAASNELPDPEGNLGAMWSRMTLRAVIEPLTASQKKALVTARMKRDRGEEGGKKEKFSLEEIKSLRDIRPFVEVPDEIVDIVLAIYRELRDDESEDFEWLWSDDRRFGRVFDIMQANALLDGRDKVGKSDLSVLEFLLWDTPEQIPVVKAKVAPYTRTPLSDAQEVVAALFAPEGAVELASAGNREKVLEAISQIEEAEKELERLKGDADGDEVSGIDNLLAELSERKQEVVGKILGTKFNVKK